MKIKPRLNCMKLMFLLAIRNFSQQAEILSKHRLQTGLSVNWTRRYMQSVQRAVSETDLEV